MHTGVIIHSKSEAIAAINGMPEKCFTDGVLMDVPKARRRSQAMKLKQIRVNLPADLQKRFAAQINRHVELLGKELGWTIMCMVLEFASNERLKALGEHEGYDDTGK